MRILAVAILAVVAALSASAQTSLVTVVGGRVPRQSTIGTMVDPASPLFVPYVMSTVGSQPMVGTLNMNSNVVSGMGYGSTFSDGTYVTPMAGVSKTYYVSNAMSWAQIQATMDAIPRNLQGGVVFQFQSGTYTASGVMSPVLNVANFYGGTLTIQGQTSTVNALGTNQSAIIDATGVTTYGSTVISIQSCSAVVNLASLMIKFNSTNVSQGVQANRASAYMNGCYMVGNGTAQGSAVTSIYGGRMGVFYTEFSNMGYSMTASLDGFIFAQGNGRTNVSPVNGCSVYMGQIVRADAQVTATTDNQHQGGGSILLSNATWF